MAPSHGRLDIDVAGNAAPLVAYGVQQSRELFATRLSCQVYGASSGMDLAALCLRK
jgi:hypothetical protein